MLSKVTKQEIEILLCKAPLNGCGIVSTGWRFKQVQNLSALQDFSNFR